MTIRAAGDVIDVRLRQESGANRSLYNSTSHNYCSIEWIG